MKEEREIRNRLIIARDLLIVERREFGTHTNQYKLLLREIDALKWVLNE